jgi:phosphoenolpyruvate carboxykinase (ATP)
MVRAILDGSLDDAPTRPDPVFGVHAVTKIEGVPSDVLDPRSTWSDPNKYDAQAQQLAEMFRQSFERYADQVLEDVRKAGPIS